MMKPEKNFEIPLPILHNLNEMSQGGFLLFSFDNNGNPQLYCSFDNTLNFFALHKHAENWVNASNMLSMDNCIDNITDSEDGDRPPPRRRRPKKDL